MNELEFAADVMARIRARGGAYHERAYLFVLALYLVFCLSMSKYSERVEEDLRKGRNF